MDSCNNGEPSLKSVRRARKICYRCDLQRSGAFLPLQVKVSLKSGNKKNETDDRRDHEARSFCRYLGFLHGLTCPQPGAGGWGHDWGHGSVKEA